MILRPLKLVFLAPLFFSFLPLSYAQVIPGDPAVIFHSTDMESGIDTKTHVPKAEIEANLEKAIQEMFLDIYAEGLISYGVKDQGETDLKEIGVFSSDLLLSELGKDQFQLEMILSFQYWGGKRSRLKETFKFSYEEAPRVLAVPRINQFRISFLNAVGRGLEAETSKLPAGFISPFKKYFDEYSVKAFVKNQESLIQAVKSFSETREKFRKKIEMSLKIKRASEAAEISEESETKVDKMLAMDQAVTAVNSTSEAPIEAPSPETFDTALPEKTVSEPVPMPSRQEPVKEEPAFTSQETSPVSTQSEPEKTQEKVSQKPASLLDEIQAPSPPVEADPAAVSEAKEEVFSTSMQPEPEKISQAEAKKEESVAQESQPIQETQPVNEPVPVMNQEPSVPPQKESALLVLSEPVVEIPSSKTPFDQSLRAYELLRLQRAQAKSGSSDYLDFSKKMGQLKQQLQVAGFYRLPPKTRDKIEAEVRSSMNQTA